MTDTILIGPLTWDGGVVETVPTYPSGTGLWPAAAAINDVGHGGSNGYVNVSYVNGQGASPSLRAKPGRTYTWHWWARRGGGFLDWPAAEVKYYDAASGLLATHTLLVAATGDPGWDVWNEITADSTAPANAASMQWTHGANCDYDTLTLSAVGECPQPVGANDECSKGTSHKASRCDHVHPHSDLSDHSGEIHHHADSIEGLEAGAPAGATYLVTTAHAGLSAEVVVGATPGGELGGTWADPTVDDEHGGSSHAEAQEAAEATAGAALAAHEGTPHGSDPSSDSAAWMPLTTVVAGEPELVWDGDDSLIPTLSAF